MWGLWRDILRVDSLDTWNVVAAGVACPHVTLDRYAKKKSCLVLFFVWNGFNTHAIWHLTWSAWSVDSLWIWAGRRAVERTGCRWRPRTSDRRTTTSRIPWRSPPTSWPPAATDPRRGRAASRTIRPKRPGTTSRPASWLDCVLARVLPGVAARKCHKRVGRVDGGRGGAPSWRKRFGTCELPFPGSYQRKKFRYQTNWFSMVFAGFQLETMLSTPLFHLHQDQSES